MNNLCIIMLALSMQMSVCVKVWRLQGLDNMEKIFHLSMNNFISPLPHISWQRTFSVTSTFLDNFVVKTLKKEKKRKETHFTFQCKVFELFTYWVIYMLNGRPRVEIIVGGESCHQQPPSLAALTCPLCSSLQCAVFFQVSLQHHSARTSPEDGKNGDVKMVNKKTFLSHQLVQSFLFLSQGPLNRNTWALFNNNTT